jgi:hypothetical protein
MRCPVAFRNGWRWGRFNPLGHQLSQVSNRPVDHAPPILCITDMQGTVTTQLTSYAWDCTSTGIDKIDGD